MCSPHPGWPAARIETTAYYDGAMNVQVGSLLADGVTGMRLVHGDAATGVQSVTHDSRAVGAGSLFVAVPGFRSDGHSFIAQAVAAGAAAVVVQDDHLSSLPALPDNVAVIATPATRLALSAVAATFYGHPSREMTVIGVTGTDGKTTTSHLLTSVLESAGLMVGRLGTVDVHRTGQTTASESRMTTPEAPDVHRELRAMADAGCRYAIVESTSHGLALQRLEDVDYDIAVMTNITGDHLDFHETFEQYRAAKARLFEMLDRPTTKDSPRAAIVNADDPSAEHCLGQTSKRAIRFALDTPDVDVSADAIDLRSDGTTFDLAMPTGSARVALHMPARFNVANALAAAAAGYALGFAPTVIAGGLESCAGVPGRMERIVCGQPFEVVVDYAHTGDALRKILEVMRSVTRGRLIVVVGAAGERDPGRRFGVGRAAAEGADYAVFTSEDPRSEEPGAIVAEIGRHAEAAGRIRGRDFVEIEDRREAIRHAVSVAGAGDVVAVCGKGHERSIIFGEASVPWDDREVAREELMAVGYA